MQANNFLKKLQELQLGTFTDIDAVKIRDILPRQARGISRSHC